MVRTTTTRTSASAGFGARTYFGGRQSTGDFNNHYELFSAGGMDFMVFHFEYDTSMETAVLDWAEAAIVANPDRQVIISTHYMINQGNPASFGAQGQAIYNALSDNANVFLLLGGHVHGEGQREDTGSNGNVIHSLLSDYQELPNGGNGWLRIMEFSPANDEITVSTYSPVLDAYGTGTTMGLDTTSAPFTLDYDMLGDPWVEIGTDTGVASGATASVAWSDRDGDTEYEWYAVANDGSDSTQSSTWTFTTGSTPGPHTVSFQQNVNEYTGTVDTWIEGTNPDVGHATDGTITVDASPVKHILLRFDDIIGSGAGQVPSNAEIVSATLDIAVDDPSSVGADLYRMLELWSESVTWNSMGSGVSTDGAQAVAVAESSSPEAVLARRRLMSLPTSRRGPAELTTTDGDGRRQPETLGGDSTPPRARPRQFSQSSTWIRQPRHQQRRRVLRWTWCRRRRWKSLGATCSVRTHSNCCGRRMASLR